MKSSMYITLLLVSFFAPLSGRASSGSVSNRIAELHQKIEQIEKQCTPANGTSRQEVETIFGAGIPLHKTPSKKPLKAPPPALSPRRAYKICENGTLVVRYDSNWNVLVSYYPNPYSIKGTKPNSQATDEQKVKRLEKRLTQMKAVLKAYNARANQQVDPIVTTPVD